MLRQISRTTYQSLRVDPFTRARRLATSKATTSGPDTPSKDDKLLENNAKETEANKTATKKTVAEADAEMMRKLAGISGEGGEAGIEYEDGKPVAMKRGVKNNMFRLI